MKQYDEKIKQKHAAGEPQMLALALKKGGTCS
jgi:hypothetical protein